MNLFARWPSRLFILLALGVCAEAQVARLTRAPLLQLPGVADSNSPSHWTDGKLVLFNSDGMPIRSEGNSVATLGRVRAVRLYSYEHTPMWIEATHKMADGTLYAWYHHEVFLFCDDNPVSAPVIGALRSDDDGKTFFDLGIVISAGGDPDCSTPNRYFGGGNGDFSAIADRNGEYIYFFYSNYSGDAAQQGIATARIRMEDLNSPVGNVYKYFEGEWKQPGLGGVESPIFAASSSWHSESPDAFWGPGIHWNKHLEMYVMVMNHACCNSDWPATGIYISYAKDLSKPDEWKQPTSLLEGGGWYPMVMGMGAEETDKLAGRTARFFMGSDSVWTIEFSPN